ncbi:MAG: hypothetical protein HY035_11855 [Nitrospirae bacterium]|nr:hypothetical protein [Nitrospirota bacterium]
MTYSNFFSGLVGTLFGVIATLAIYLHSRYTASRRALADRLIILRYDVWWNCTDTDVFKTWDASLKDIWILYNAYYDVAPLWRRRSIKKAWDKYKGVNHYILDHLPNVPDVKMFPKSKEEFIQNITSFLKAL